MGILLRVGQSGAVARGRLAPDLIGVGRPAAAPRSPLAARWSAITSLPRSLWRRQSLRSRLLIIVVAIEVVAAVVAGIVTVQKARTATRIEIAASIRVAQLLVTESLRLVRDDTPAHRILETLPLQLQFLRHVRLSVRDATGAPVAHAIAAPTDGAPALIRKPTPDWFRGLVAPPIRSESIPVVTQGESIGSVVLVSEPDDEIAEVWENTVALGSVGLAVNVIVLGVLYVLFGRALAPLAGFGRGLIDLEQRNYAVRLPMPQAHDFIPLTERFNTLAAALEISRAENATLSRRLITAEDDERRRTALELHDEFGPCLFGLKATAASITGLAEEKAGSHKVVERARDMLPIIEHLQVVNRNLLNRLRPMALGHVPLGDLLGQIVRDRAREHPHLSLSLRVDGLAASYGEAADLTIYRCVQESLTNAIRHAQAASIQVTLAEERNPDRHGAARARLQLTVEDDGAGFTGVRAWGFGLRGMQERVIALDGALTIGKRPTGGTIVRIMIPCASSPEPADEPPRWLP